MKELVQPTVIEFPLKDMYRHVELISPGEEPIQLDSERVPTMDPEDHTRPYKGSSRPKHILLTFTWHEDRHTT